MFMARSMHGILYTFYFNPFGLFLLIQLLRSMTINNLHRNLCASY